MNFIAQVEEHLRDLGAEARKKHPGVKEASERAILQLRTLQNAYVTAVRKATQTGTTHPTTELFRSQDILRPFLLAANYPNASPKLLEISLSAMSLLIEGNAICPGDGIHMVRVWTIQANGCAAALQSSKAHGKQQTQQATASSTTTPSSSTSSSWFGGMLSSATDVSSSSGQGGNPKQRESEKLALELLSCLIQLLELRDLPVTDEQWAASVALCCILLHVHKSTTVPQAAKSTLHQVLALLFEQKNDTAVDTWNDLLVLANGNTTKQQQPRKGAFSHCTGTLQQTKTGPLPPSPTICLELAHILLSQPHSWLAQERSLMDPTFELTQRQVSLEHLSLETLWRSFQLAKVLLPMKNAAANNNDLVASLVQGIVTATETCRKSHDFEDGHVYLGGGDLLEPSKKKPTTTLVPDAILWKAGLALETLYCVLPHVEHQSIVAEAISDFCTICASCQDHIQQLVRVVDSKNGNDETLTTAAPEPTIMFHSVEEACKAETTTRAGENASVSSKSCSMGDALWIAFHVILKLSHNMETSVDGCFAPSLAVFQHYLKRFPGCDPIVQLSLEGYISLANVAIPGNALLRQALLASLCKLSLPSWGKHDPACQLENHHVESLLCLLKILHKHYDFILSDWRMVLWTFQELSGLLISSAILSDEGYTKALAVSCAFSRIAPLTTCLSAESLTCVIDALADVSISCLENEDILTETDAISRAAGEVARPRRDSSELKQHHRRVSTSSSIGGDLVDAKPRDSMTGRLIGFAGRTLLGSSQTPEVSEHKTAAPLPVVEERTRSTYFDAYRRDFLQRLLSSKRAIRSDSTGKLPFSLVALTDVSLANIYRYQVCGTSISNHFCSIAVASPDVRDYSMDILAMLIASQLTDEAPIPSNVSGPGRIAIERPMKNQYLTVEAVSVQDAEGNTEAANDEALSQADLIAPLCTTIRTVQSSELAEAGISAMLSILEGAGHNMTDDVWNVLISAIASLSGDASKRKNDQVDRSGNDWATCCMLAFRCLKLIVDDFLDQLPPMSDSPSAPRRALLDCCSSFGSSRHDVNISLTAIGLLWHIADLDSHSWSIDRALSELVVLSSDDRTEVRNCAVNTLFSCVVGRGEGFTSKQWDVCISQTVFGVYDLVALKGGIGEADSNGDAEVKRSKSASDRYRVSVHHSRDSAGKQWTTTQVLVLQGLGRVLRNFFPQLLETMDNTPSDDVGDLDYDPVWFKRAWTRILQVALDAARQPSSRETLELRTVGVNLLVQCCQFTCRAGMQAAIAPAVVGTNMEVVNGALRHVDESSSSPDNEDTHTLSSAEVEEWRECFFLTAFDALDSYRNHFESDVENDSEVVNSHYMEATQVQVLHKLTLGLTKLYEGCKDNEFAPWQAPDFQQHNLALNSSFVITNENLEGRFVHLVASIAKTAKGDPNAQFLTQAQRSALELLRLMSNQTSDEAMRVLAVMGGHSFLWVAKKDSDDDATIDENANGAFGCNLLSREAAKAVTEELSSGTILDETKVQVLYKILSNFVADMSNKEAGMRRTHQKKSYALLVPIIEAGLESASRLAVAEDASWLDPLWDSVTSVLDHLLVPVQTASNGSYMARSSSLLEILTLVVSHVPPGRRDNVFDLLSAGVSSSMDVARGQKITACDESMSAEVRRKARTRADEALKVFESCLDGMCKLKPQSPVLQELCRNVLEEALGGDENVAVIVCQVVSKNTGMERLAIGIFSILSRLISVDNELLRIEAGNILGRVDVGQVLEEATRRCEAAEERAQDAEEHIQELMDEIEDLREENQSLNQQILVYSTSSSLT